jgi:hypothetical protein
MEKIEINFISWFDTFVKIDKDNNYIYKGKIVGYKELVDIYAKW